MHGQITYKTRTVFRSRCACGWESDEYASTFEAGAAYDEHVEPFLPKTARED